MWRLLFLLPSQNAAFFVPGLAIRKNINELAN